MSTEVGHISGMLQQQSESKSPLTRQLEKLTKQLVAIAGLALVAFVALNMARGQTFTEVFTVAVASLDSAIGAATGTDTASVNVRNAARVLKARAIVAFTQSGFSARLISQERPEVPIIALTPFAAVQRRLGLTWGVSSRLIRKVETTDEMIEEIEATLLGDGSVRVNDVIVIISGAPMWVTGTTNLLKLHRVGERR
jgi:pyruvate kinase